MLIMRAARQTTKGEKKMKIYTVDSNKSAASMTGHWGRDGFQFGTYRMFVHRFSSPFWYRNNDCGNITAAEQKE